MLLCATRCTAIGQSRTNFSRRLTPATSSSMQRSSNADRCAKLLRKEEIMTRAQIEQDYKVENGRIRSPGMFEGEMVYVPYFWDAYLNGAADRDNGTILGFDITPEDKKEFPELKNRRTVKLYQRDDGFVCEV